MATAPSIHQLCPAPTSGAPIRRFEKFEARLELAGSPAVVDARFDLLEGSDVVLTQIIPCFQMRPAPRAPSEWRVRFGPPAQALGVRRWRISLRVDDGPFSESLFEFHCEAARRDGPLLAPHDGEFYFKQVSREEGAPPRPVFLVGQAMPWAFASGASATDRRRDLLEPMARAGMNLNLTWLAPWETMLLHRAPVEEWHVGPEDSSNPSGPTVVEIPVPQPDTWRPWSHIDQGRAARLDEIVAAHDDNDIHQILVLWPHDALAAHHWRPEASSRMNGLSALPRLDLPGFFAAGPGSEAWRWQQQLYRYCVARWGYSRTLFCWMVVAELEGVGPTPFAGDFWQRHGRHTHAWNDRVMRTLRELDWRQRPITSSTTQFHQHPQDPYTHAREIPDRGDFAGYEESVDLICMDVYPTVHAAPSPAAPNDWVNHEQSFVKFCRTALATAQPRLWHHGVARMFNWTANTSHLPMPKLVSEFGLVERDDLSSPLRMESQVRSYVHYVIWAAFAAGHAGTPLKWCDQNRFGSMFPHGRGAFRAEAYPDLSREYAAMVALLAADGPLPDVGRLCRRFTPWLTTHAGTASSVRGFGLSDPTQALRVIWLFDDDPANLSDRSYAWADDYGRTHAKRSAADAHARDRLNLDDLPAHAALTVSRFNTWEGTLDSVERVTSDERGFASLAIGQFATASADRSEKVWDGADMLLILRPAGWTVPS